MTLQTKRSAPMLLLAGALALTASASARASNEAFDCVIEPSLALRIGSPIVGILSGVEAERGDVVRQGQVVARLESSVETATLGLARARAESTAEIDARRARVDQMRSELNRAASLHTSAVVSTQRIEELRANASIAASELALAELNRRLAALEVGRAEALLEQRVIRSPVNGVVTTRNLGPGEYVNQDNFILGIARLDPLNVETYLPLRLYRRIRTGMRAVVRPDSPVGGSYDAQIGVIDEVFDAASGTFGVRLMLPNADLVLPGGLRCRVEFTLSAEPAAAR
jgi:RND family efflux transporter MFP subunit